MVWGVLGMRPGAGWGLRVQRGVQGGAALTSCASAPGPALPPRWNAAALQGAARGAPGQAPAAQLAGARREEPERGPGGRLGGERPAGEPGLRECCRGGPGLIGRAGELLKVPHGVLGGTQGVLASPQGVLGSP